ncbi:MAG: phospho-N-acetylmuramoyl-pentapeptide-transferase, partial [Deltaproteobacteria bacterium]|nr:phospho-N-acetylmuramoyl-pentapeptide-transferase [Deltaproteobacteria bacterium]
MLAEFLYWLIPYQIFKSVFFRAGLTYLTTYFLINLFIPKIIRLFRQKGITSDFKVAENSKGPYSGATPIMGGIILIPAIVISTILWAWLNKYTISLLVIISSFAFIGGIDDIMKVFHKRKIEAGVGQKEKYIDKADGISGKIRLLFEFSITSIVIIGIYYFSNGLENYLVIPGIPIANWHPEIPVMLFV